MAKPRRPRDPNELAAFVVEAATEGLPPESPDKRNQSAVALGRLGGLKGGKARASKLTKTRRSAIARKAARTRWKQKK